MTPAGHVSVSFIAGSWLFRGQRRNTVIPALIIGGIAPDMDFLFFLFDWFNKVHRVISHNLLFITVVALVGAVISGREKWMAAASGLFIGGLLHLAIDSCLDNNPTNGIGIAFFWPFLEGLYSPFNLLTANDAGIGWDQPGKMLGLMMPLVLYEIPLYLIAAFLLFRQRADREKERIDNP